jgi:PAS domain S-box-containing protein
LATAAVLVSALVFVGIVPFAHVPLGAAPAFIPAYETALVIIDLITAVLLLQQFGSSRPTALFVLATGYLFDALLTVAHALSFPGLITAAGWLGGSSQTTAWPYMFWHAGFPLFVIAYAESSRRAAAGEPATVDTLSAALTLAAIFGSALLLIVIAIEADSILPPIMSGDSYTTAMRFVVGATWVVSAVALAVLLLKRPYSALDLWLLVVMVAWLADIGLSAVFNAGRFDLGFYAGRAYGLLAVGFVLGGVLVQTGWLHRHLAAATDRLEEQARELTRRVEERTRDVARANRQLNAMLEASPVAIYMLDRNGEVLLWTASAERLFGYAEREALGRHPPYLAEDQLTELRVNVARAADGIAPAGAVETKRCRKDGAMLDVSLRWARVEDESGHLLGILVAAADITERKKLEMQLRQSQKMEAVGTLTGGLAHDFNNHLWVIILNLDVLGEQLEGDSEAEELTREAMAAAMRGADLIRRLLAFTRRQPLEPQRVDINRLVAEITQLLGRTLGEEIKMTLALDAAVWPTVVDPAQLEAALANLATNARDAMPNGGELTIATGNRHLDDDYAAQHAELAPGDYAMIEVSDTGAGMPPDVIAQAFEPFFTTKPPGKGTGLGLSMVFGFIKQSGGHINIYSEVGAGTTVRLYLPRGDGRTDRRDAPVVRGLLRGRGESVLAVEDNPGLRRVVARQLTDIGYRVIEAEDAGAALLRLQQEGVAVLFTDVVLPGGTSGYELARRAQALRPDIKIVLTSGFPENRIADGGNLPNIKLLSKPYRREDIARVIAAALHAEGG